LARFLRWLPDGSAFRRSFVGEEMATWTLDRQLAAMAVDALQVSNWQRGSGKRSEYPKPIDRPGATTTKKQMGDASQLTQEQVLAVLASRREPKEG
jgi:hypothetical protein